ncbi:spore cortex-lytic enzyme [Paenibacillus sp. FSL R7-0048]|jgi:N-acetylmuramoyl-L-alanine amidase|uniref:Spore cortex-lytic enzyme n=1 Tax=Paenibacillus odorifer TaxID=189426 RepID=A0ABX3GSY4_9BACL|nr:spore cortex-lytic enzyme [Paenibacillus odorifer]OMD35802.1 spore cortex-lytic enzyme [Paenibacillus odorifer]OMD61612.1 spore cortex-lytic enzyme [Paenibacillus odorifer]OMD70797.1 spore cortex-lytic enzyme [Paenibacillus odorifer]OMD76986.1 spore cortex-lytic enzyme [Paenibacillus odorifer]OMD86068.1 spore cortex-lytic enzyme [Paenibacillus odorifer]
MKKHKLWIFASLTLALAAAPFAGMLLQGNGILQTKQSAAASFVHELNHPEEEALPAFSTTPIKLGSSGQDVYELQGRLKHLGFYEGKIDSQFGPKTKNSVTWFQWKFGMKSDGIVGAKTKLKLYNATKNWKPTESASATGNNTANNNTGNKTNTTNNSDSASLSSGNTMGLSENDLKIMANAVYGESRGEPFEGQVAVAAVILNRVKSPSFPNTPSGVIFQPGAFTAVADGQIYLEPNEQARKAVQQALNGWDPSGGCLYYFNPKTATSKWIWTRPQVKTIGQHIFCM